MFSLGAGGVSERSGDMGLAGAGVAHQQDVLALVKLFSAHELGDEMPVDGGFGRKIEGVEGLEDGKTGGADAAFGIALLEFKALVFAQARQKLNGIVTILGTGGRYVFVFALDNGRLEQLQVMVEQHERAFCIHQFSPPSRAA